MRQLKGIAEVVMAEVLANRIAATFPQDFVRNYRFPDDYQLTSEMRRFAVDHGLKDPDEEFRSFLAECVAADSKFFDWGAAWRCHVRRLKEAYEIDAYAPHSRVLFICGQMKSIDDLIGETSSLETERDELREDLQDTRAELRRIRKAIGAAYGQARSAETKKF
jgi:hypothetical protein